MTRTRISSARPLRSELARGLLSLAAGNPLSHCTLATTAQAGSIFDFFSRRRSAHMLYSPDPRPDLPVRSEPRTNIAASASPGRAFCVRLCDGRYYPIASAASNSTPVQMCSAMCPAAQTKVFRGGDIAPPASSSRAAPNRLEQAFRLPQERRAGLHLQRHGPVRPRSCRRFERPDAALGRPRLDRRGPQGRPGRPERHPGRGRARPAPLRRARPAVAPPHLLLSAMRSRSESSRSRFGDFAHDLVRKVRSTLFGIPSPSALPAQDREAIAPAATGRQLLGGALCRHDLVRHALTGAVR